MLAEYPALLQLKDLSMVQTTENKAPKYAVLALIVVPIVAIYAGFILGLFEHAMH